MTDDRPTTAYELNPGDVFIIREAIAALPPHQRHNETLAKFADLANEDDIREVLNDDEIGEGQ